jgi:hypothetical protein
MEAEALRTRALSLDAALSDSRMREDELARRIVALENRSLLKFLVRGLRRQRIVRARH